MTHEELSERMRRLDTDQLKQIIRESSKDYTKEALSIIKEELASRGEEAPVVKARPQGSAAPPPNASFLGGLLALVGYALMGLGLILAVLMYSKTKLVLCISVVVGSVAAGLLFLGVSEVIKLLMELRWRSAADDNARDHRDEL